MRQLALLVALTACAPDARHEARAEKAVESVASAPSSAGSPSPVPAIPSASASPGAAISPLRADGPFVKLPVQGFGDAVVSVPEGATSPRPVVVAVHGNYNRPDSLCELNVIEQVLNVCQSTVVQEAWERGQPLSVHGWVYSLNDGLIRDMRMTVSASSETSDVFQTSLAELRSRASR